MNSPMIKKSRKLSNIKTNRLIFYSIMIAVPVIHFLIFYVYINFNSILLSLKEYTLAGMGGYEWEFAGLKNFATAVAGAYFPRVLYKKLAYFSCVGLPYNNAACRAVFFLSL